MYKIIFFIACITILSCNTQKTLQHNVVEIEKTEFETHAITDVDVKKQINLFQLKHIKGDTIIINDNQITIYGGEILDLKDDKYQSDSLVSKQEDSVANAFKKNTEDITQEIEKVSFVKPRTIFLYLVVLTIFYLLFMWYIKNKRGY